MMERLNDIHTSDYPNVPEVPIWLNDRKPANFGKSESGEIKVRDYTVGNLEDILRLGGTIRSAFAGRAL